VADEAIPFPGRSEAVPISPALNLVLEDAQIPQPSATVDRRVVWLCGVAIGIGVLGALVAEVFVRLIALITNLAFYGELSLTPSSPSDNHLGLFVLVIPIIGGVICGLMARYGSKAIRGHGIPEAMEQILTNRSRIPARITFLKPISAAISIGTGGPFGAEGPIIATGSALGSLVGQFFRTTATERKTLLAAGAAAGMAAIFGTPVAAVLLAIELLLFEFRPRSIIPVAFASVTADAMRSIFHIGPVFPMPDVATPTVIAMVFYILLGAVMGVAAAMVIRIVYFTEDTFEKLPIHWMWWPALGGIAVGVCGFFVPRTLGVGYENIWAILSNQGNWPIKAVAILCAVKFISWTISIGSGTSGGTMAPLFTIGGALGQVLAGLSAMLLPGIGIDLRVAGLVGMAAMFAGASRAFLASTVFAFEATQQPFSLLPLLGGCAASYLISMLLVKNSLMTEKIIRRGVAAPLDYTPDVLEQVLVRDIASKHVVALSSNQTLGQVRLWIAADGPDSQHQGFPVVDGEVLIGILTRRDFLTSKATENTTLKDLITRLPKFVYEDTTARQAVDHMVRHEIGRLPVMSHDKPPKLVGMLTRSDILSVYRRGLDEHAQEAPTLKVPRLRRPGKKRTA
jgi:chloride channel protein, CIC family